LKSELLHQDSKENSHGFGLREVWGLWGMILDGFGQTCDLTEKLKSIFDEFWPDSRKSKYRTGKRWKRGVDGVNWVTVGVVDVHRRRGIWGRRGLGFVRVRETIQMGWGGRFRHLYTKHPS